MLLNIKNFSVAVQVNGANKILVDDITLDVEEQKIVALVGGSGSGKTTTGLSILRLLAPELRVTQGAILLNDKNLLAMPEAEMRFVRGREVSMVFQEPLDAFNPVFQIGYQIEEVLKYHLNLPTQQRRNRVNELLDVVGIPDPKRIAQAYPHQLSGGLRQRAMIAQALAGNPKLIIADEPTSNLDVTLQAKIMDLFRKLRKELQLTVLLITHDLGMVKHLADEVAVMSSGRIIEKGKTTDVLMNPTEEYTRQLMEAVRI